MISKLKLTFLKYSNFWLLKFILPFNMFLIKIKVTINIKIKNLVYNKTLSLIKYVLY